MSSEQSNDPSEYGSPYGEYGRGLPSEVGSDSVEQSSDAEDALPANHLTLRVSVNKDLIRGRRFSEHIRQEMGRRECSLDEVVDSLSDLYENRESFIQGYRFAERQSPRTRTEAD